MARWVEKGKEKQRKDKGETIEATAWLAPNPLGWGLVAASELGATMAAPARK
jgi:hypothetical protein